MLKVDNKPLSAYMRLVWDIRDTESLLQSRQVLSADSHVLEPPDLWTTRM